MSFSERARGLLAEASAAYRGRPAGRRLEAVARHLDEPLRVALAGRVKAGKSTLLNALVGQRVAATDAGECTRVVTWYGYGSVAQATAYPHSGTSRELRFVRHGDGVALDLVDLRSTDLDQIRVDLPATWLTRMTLVDTPGMGSLSESLGRQAQDFLASELGDVGDAGGVDAVIYLLRQLHASDVDFLEVLSDAQLSSTTPVNAVGVLSRADEIGGGGTDAIEQAHRISTRYREDPRMRGLVQTVLPVAGLLAEAATSLGPEEYADLLTLARLPEATSRLMLVSATRFVATPGVPLPPDRRHRLLRLLGMYGVRLALQAVRRAGAQVRREDLVALLTRRSGLTELRRLLLTQFAERRDVLKADSALRTVDAVTRADPIPAAGHLRQQVERLRLGAHELAEIRVLTELRTGQIPAAPEQLAPMDRLLGGDGSDPAVRLGLSPDPTESELREAVAGFHAYWRRVARSPLTEPQLARAADVLLRTCEGLAAALGPAPPPPPAPVEPPAPPATEPEAPGPEALEPGAESAAEPPGTGALTEPTVELAPVPRPDWTEQPTQENHPVQS
jgi:hypothetical protein